MMLGRQQVKTRVEKSPFNVINNQVANNQTVTHQMGRGGKETLISTKIDTKLLSTYNNFL